MAEKGREIEVVPAQGGGFELVENGLATERLVFDKTHDRVGKSKMKKKDEYQITFFLDDLGQYRFNRANPMLVEGSGCPYPPDDPEFSVDDVDDYILVVKNRDRNVRQYKFTLNLLDAHNNDIPYDPIYDNKNGGEP